MVFVIEEKGIRMNDSISRQEILRTLPSLCIGFDCRGCPFHNGDGMIHDCLLEQWINSLPSVESEQDLEWRKKHYEASYNQGYVDACKYCENLLERIYCKLLL